MLEQKDKLWTSNFIFMCVANFLMSFSFYILIPTLPFYLIDTFKAGQSVVGIILSIYTISVLAVRPFSGFLADTFQRKPLYLFAYFIFASFFVGYALAGTLLIFTIVRVIHGLAFGMLSTTGNTLVIDVMPSSRRGEGLGYFGVTGNIAMAIGPMTGLILKDIFPFDYIFMLAAISGAVHNFVHHSCHRLDFPVGTRNRWQKPSHPHIRTFLVLRIVDFCSACCYRYRSSIFYEFDLILVKN